MKKRIQLGDYEIIRRIAKGGMGEVFLAQPRRTGNAQGLVAIKVPRRSIEHDRKETQSFMDEAKASMLLKHPGIVSLVEVGRHQGISFLAFEFIEGITMLDLFIQRPRVKRSPRFPVGVVKVISQAARALDYAHRLVDEEGSPMKLIHRDINPRNIMIDVHGDAKILDFGVASFSNREYKTSTGLLRGHLGYVSPEQVTGRELDARTDQYSLGVLFWECLAGKRLRNSKSSAGFLMQEAESVRPPKLSDQGILVSPAIEEIVFKMTHLTPEDRYRSCAEVADALDQLLSEQSESSETDTGTTVKRLYAAESGSCDEDGLEELAARLAGETKGSFTEKLIDDDFVPAGYTVKEPLVLEKKRAKPSRYVYFLVPLVLILLAFLFLWQHTPPAEPSVAEGARLKRPEQVIRAHKFMVNSVPSQAKVFIDGTLVGETPFETVSLVPERSYLLKLRKNQYQSYTETFVIGPKAVQRRDIRLKAKPRKRIKESAKTGITASDSSKLKPPGFLRIESRPWVRVRIDGRPESRITPISKMTLPVGNYRIRFQNKGSAIDEYRSVSIRPGEETYLNLNFKGP